MAKRKTAAEKKAEESKSGQQESDNKTADAVGKIDGRSDSEKRQEQLEKELEEQRQVIAGLRQQLESKPEDKDDDGGQLKDLLATIESMNVRMEEQGRLLVEANYGAVNSRQSVDARGVELARRTFRRNEFEYPHQWFRYDAQFLKEDQVPFVKIPQYWSKIPTPQDGKVTREMLKKLRAEYNSRCSRQTQGEQADRMMFLTERPKPEEA